MTAHDAELASRIRGALAERAPVSEVREKQMFGGLAFMVEGTMVASADSHGRLMVRCDPDRTDTLVGCDGAARPVMGTRTMSRGWLAVPAEAVAADDRLWFWLNQALTATGATSGGPPS